MTIPHQLADQRFIKTKEKIPFEQDWTNTNNYSLHDKEFENYLRTAYTYGILCGHNNLLVLDLDSEAIQEDLLNTYQWLKSTFTVKTAGKGLYHIYLYTDLKPNSAKILDSELNTLMDIQGQGKQVIGPGSQLSTGKRYEVINDVPILKVEYSKILEIIDRYGQKNEKTKSKGNDNRDPLIEQIKDALSIGDFLSKIGISTRKNPTDCPFHDSAGKKCFSYTDKLWNCFHCGKKGDLFTLYQEYYNCSFVEAKNELIKITGIVKKEEKKKALEEYKEINVSKYVMYKSKDDTVYKIYINDFYISMTPDEVLNPNMFRKKYFNETGKLLKPISAFDWCDLTNKWVSDVGETKDQSNETIDNHTTEIVINDLKEFAVVFTPRDALSYGRLYFDKDKSDYLFLSHKVADLIIKKNNFKINISRMKYLLDEYIIGKSEVMRTGKTTGRFFKLDRAKIGIDVDYVEEKEDDKEEDD